MNASETFKPNAKGDLYIKLVEAQSGSTWRELQQKFDPYFHYSYLKFYTIGNEITNKENQE